MASTSNMTPRSPMLLIAAACLAAAPLPAACLYKRLMPAMNFAGHNLPGLGCAPVKTANTTTAVACQGACDAESTCDMWTFVDRPGSGHEATPPGPWCCLKGCKDR